MAATEANKNKTVYTIFKGSGDTKFVTIPQAIAHEHNLKHGDKVEWVLYQGMLCLKKSQ